MDITKAATFGAVDYSVFIIVLLISMGIGIYFGYFGKSSNSAQQYLSGIQDIKITPIAISIVASLISSTALMSFPNEVYSYGIMIALVVPAMFLSILFVAYIFIPVYFKTRVSNAYEYLERRFDWKTNKMASIFFIITTYAYSPFVLYMPSLAFSQVTGVNVHVTNTVVGSICIIYTMIGGIKAVVWTDVVQAVVMVLALLGITIYGVINLGGIDVILKRAEEGGRLHLFDFDPDLTKRNTFWGMLFYCLGLNLGHIGFSQTCVQRLIALKSEVHARRVLFYYFVGFAVISLLSYFSGLMIFATYYNCDPVKANIISKGDKIVPYFVMNTIGHWIGMPGLFIAAIFSASLSTLSAQLNSLSGVMYQDYFRKLNSFEQTDFRARLIMKLVILVSGIYFIVAGFIIDSFGHMTQFLVIAGTTLGLTTGVFTLGMLTPWANKHGALYGTIISGVISVWMIIGNQMALNDGSLSYPTLPTSVEGCEISNDTIITAMNITFNSIASTSSSNRPFILYRLSFYTFAMVSVVLVWVFGLLISFLTGYTKPGELDKDLIAACIHWMLPKESCIRVPAFEEEHIPNLQDNILSFNRENNIELKVPLYKSS